MALTEHLVRVRSPKLDPLTLMCMSCNWTLSVGTRPDVEQLAKRVSLHQKKHQTSRRSS